MNHVIDHKKATTYTSINRLIQTKKYSGISAFPPYAASAGKEQISENNELLSAVSEQTVSASRANNTSGLSSEGESGQRAEIVATAADTAPESAGIAPASTSEPAGDRVRRGGL